jgi:hypothetical protein
MTRYRYDGEPRHAPCACGCGELSDECAGPRPNPLGSMRISERPQPNPYHPKDDQ